MSNTDHEEFMTAFQTFIIALLNDARTKGLVFVVLLLFLGASASVSWYLWKRVERLADDLTECAIARTDQGVRLEFQEKEIVGLKDQVARLTAMLDPLPRRRK